MFIAWHGEWWVRDSVMVWRGKRAYTTCKQETWSSHRPVCNAHDSLHGVIIIALSLHCYCDVPYFYANKNKILASPCSDGHLIELTFLAGVSNTSFRSMRKSIDTISNLRCPQWTGRVLKFFFYIFKWSSLSCSCPFSNQMTSIISNIKFPYKCWSQQQQQQNWRREAVICVRINEFVDCSSAHQSLCCAHIFITIIVQPLIAHHQGYCNRT